MSTRAGLLATVCSLFILAAPAGAQAAESQIASGASNACAINSNSLATCWGFNLDGGSTIPSDLGTVKQISPGAFHTCALTTSDQVRCWGGEM